MNNLAEFGIREQELCGNPKDKAIEEMLPHFHVHYPPNSEFRMLDLYHTLQTDPAKALDLENLFVGFSYAEILKRGHYLSVVHDHTRMGRLVGWLASRDIPVVRTEHGPMLPPYASDLESQQLKFFEQVMELKESGAVPSNFHFVAISESQRSEIPHLPWIAVVHNGVHIPDFEFAEEKRGNPEFGFKKYFLVLGRITPDKGTHNAIEIARAHGIPLIIAGQVEKNRSAEAYFNKEIKPHLSSKVIHIAGVNGEQRRRLYRDASCFLMPIEWPEPFGNVIVEALASGTPVLGFNNGALPEIVDNGKTGIVVDTVQDAIDAVTELGNIDPRECRRQAELKFSSPVMTAKYIAVYMEAERRFKSKCTDTNMISFSPFA